MSDVVEEIKSRLDIVELIREYIPLQQTGDNFRARCPFHQEKTPSFMVSQSKQIWHCFGSCNEGGDIFSYVMRQEGIEFGESLVLLAQRAGVQLDRQDPRVATRKNTVLDVLEYAGRYYAYILKTNPSAHSARDYLAARGIDPAAWEEHGIGFAPRDPDALVKVLLAKKFPIQPIIDAGLAIKREQGYGFFDRFRGRLMIPIRDIHGHVIGFGGRILEDTLPQKSAKYINSPDTLVYDKSKVVYGLDRAKHEIRKIGYCILVEGYMDVFSVSRAGMKHVVATSGTALTQDQIRLIKRFTDTFYFAFDADAAGSRATVRGIEMALREGITVKVITLPRDSEGKALYKDPDECARKDLDAWRRSVDAAKSFLDFHFERVFSDPQTREDIFLKRKAIAAFFSVLALVPDRISQDHWIKILAHHVNTSEFILWEELGRLTRKQDQAPNERMAPLKQEQSHREETFFAFLFGKPTLLHSLGVSLTSDMFENQAHQQMFHSLVSGKAPVESATKEAHDRLILFYENEYAHLEESEQLRTICMVGEHIRDRALKKRIQILKDLMQQAEARGDHDAVEQYTREFSSLVSGK